MLMLAPGDLSDRHHKAMNLAYRHDVFAKFMFHSENRIFWKTERTQLRWHNPFKSLFPNLFPN